MRRRGFTLTEILIVIALIVLMLGLAVPAFNLVRGSRSVDGAENQVAAMLGRARADAIGLQQPHGIMFFIDPTTDRVTVAEVFAADYPPPNAVPAATRDVYLDLAPDTDFLPLPPGVLAFVLADGSVNVNTGIRASDGYLGYNQTLDSNGTALTAVPQLGGVILFNGDGQLISRTYGYRTRINDVATKMQALIGVDAPGSAPDRFVDAGAQAVQAPLTQQPGSALGFVLCDREQFTANGTLADPVMSNTAYSQAEFNEEKWIDDNSSALIINRYNGTLTRAD